VLSEIDDLITQVKYMQDGKLKCYKTLKDLQQDTGEIKLNKAIASVMLNKV